VPTGTEPGDASAADEGRHIGVAQGEPAAAHHVRPDAEQGVPGNGDERMGQVPARRRHGLLWQPEGQAAHEDAPTVVTALRTGGSFDPVDLEGDEPPVEVLGHGAVGESHEHLPVLDAEVDGAQERRRHGVGDDRESPHGPAGRCYGEKPQALGPGKHLRPTSVQPHRGQHARRRAPPLGPEDLPVWQLATAVSWVRNTTWDFWLWSGQGQSFTVALCNVPPTQPR
jgi:hypothetical protein